MFFSEKVLIILGSENKGIGKSSKFFDFHVSIPINKEKLIVLTYQMLLLLLFFQLNKVLIHSQ